MFTSLYRWTNNTLSRFSSKGGQARESEKVIKEE